MSSFLSKTIKFFVLSVLLFTALVFVQKVSAAVLSAGALFSSCGDIQAAGTYYLDADISTTSPACINITSSGVTIYATTTKTITGNIIATSTGNSSGYSFTISGAVGLLGDTNLSGAGSGTAGTLTLNGTSYNNSTVTGDVVFNDSSYNSGVMMWTVRTGAGAHNWKSITSSADGTKLAAVGSNSQIYTSTDSGASWTPRDSNRGWTAVTSSSDGTKLAAVEIGGQIYTSTDSGATWTPRESNRQWQSITSSADGTKLAAVVYGGGRIYTSTDSGVTWTPRESDRNWISITSSADGTKLAAVVYGGGQIYTSTDSGATWTPRESSRNWYSITSSADGTKLAAVVQNGQIYTSTDSGVSWTSRDESRNWYGVTSSADGTKLAAVVYGGGFIYTSTNSGVTWTPGELNSWWYSVASSADGAKLATVQYGGIIYTSTIGSVFGDVIFNNSSYNAGAVSSVQAVFNGSSYNSGVASSSHVIFNDSSYNTGSIVANTATFNNASYSQGPGTVTGSAVFNDGTYNNSEVTGNAVFNDDSYNLDYIIGDAVFNSNSYMQDGYVTGNAVFTADSYSWNTNSVSLIPISGVSQVSGVTSFIPASGTTTVTFNVGDPNDPNNTTLCSGGQCYWNIDTTNWDFGSSTAVWNLYGDGYVFGSINIKGNLNAYGTSNVADGANVQGDVVFNDDSFLYQAGVGGNAVFNDRSINQGWVGGNATFNGDSYMFSNGSGYTAGVQGDVTLNDNSSFANMNNSGNPGPVQIDGNLTLNTTYYGPLPVGGLFTLNNGGKTSGGTTPDYAWRGGVVGNIYGSDNQLITDYVFNGSMGNSTTINGNAVFNDSSWNEFSSFDGSNYAIVNGNAVFNGSSYHRGTVNGNAVFNDTSSFSYDGSGNGGNIYGNAVFNDTSFVFDYDISSGLSIGGNADFYDSSYIMPNSLYWANGITTFHYANFDENFTCILKNGFQSMSVVFASSSPVFNFNNIGCGSNWDFSPTTWDFGTSTPTFNFYGNTEMSSLITGNVNFYDSSYNGQGNITGDVTFNNTANNSGDITGTVIFNDQSYSNNANIAGDVTFNDTTVNYSNNLTSNNVIFNDDSYNDVGAVVGNAVFNGLTYNAGEVSGNATFTADSYSFNSNSGSVSPNKGTVSGGMYFIPASGTTTVTFNIGDPNDPNNTTFCNGSQCYWNDSSSLIFGDGNGSVTPIWNFYGNSYNTNSLYASSNGVINFYNTSYNIGTIYGNPIFRVNAGYGYNDSNGWGIIEGNVDVYYPADKPIGGTVNGTVTYHGYPGFYFNDSVSVCDIDSLCGAGDGDWDNPLNWWTNDTFQTHAGTIGDDVPNPTDDVILYSSVTQVSLSGGSNTATAWSAIFNGGAQNGITLTVTDGATFNATSSNAGVINGDALFNGDESSTVVGTVLGNTITRQFTENATTSRDFTAEGGRDNWILIARNAIVDITGALYNTSLNLFKTFNGMFVVNSGSPHVTPQINIISPTTGTNAKWTPNIDWDDSAVCEYSWNNFTTTQTLNCASDGSDIPRPVNGSAGPVVHTLSVRGTNGNTLPGVAEKSINFTYDNTLPIDTDCSADLDEPRLYYTLSGNVVGNCTVTVDTEIRGAGYSVSGNVNAVGKNLVLKNITVGGTVNTSATTVGASAGNLSISSSTVDIITANGASAGNGGNITIATSTTGAIYANGGSTSANNTDGGNGGNITITYSLGNASSTAVSSTGGNSTVCGNGGNGGTVTITNSGDYATPTVTGGTGHSCGGGGGGSSGQSGSGTVAGNPPGYTAPSAPAAPSVPSVPTRNSAGSGSSVFANSPFSFGDSKNSFTIPVAEFKPLELQVLPTFGGEGKGSFSFENLFGKFLFDPLTTSIENLKDSKNVAKMLASVGLYNQQDLLLKYKKPYPLPENLDAVSGWITVEADGKNVPLAVGYIGKSLLVEQATVNASSTVTFSVISTSKSPVTATFNNVKYSFKKVAGTAGAAGANKYSLTLPALAVGNYTLSVNVAPLDLNLQVVQPKVVAPVKKVEEVKKQSVWGVLKFWQ